MNLITDYPNDKLQEAVHNNQTYRLITMKGLYFRELKGIGAICSHVSLFDFAHVPQVIRRSKRKPPAIVCHH